MNNRSIFSAYELALNTQKNSKLPVNEGIKCNFTSDDSDHTKLSSHQELDDYYKYLSEERITRKSNLSVGKWDKEQHIVRVEVQKGIHFQRFGHQTSCGLFLQPEEALFLLDMGLLTLMFNELPLSVHEAYMIILPVLPSWEYYQVFSHLCKLGFVVKRHKSSNITASAADVIKNEPICTGERDQCVLPEEASSTSVVLEKLQIIKSTQFKDFKSDVDSNHQRYTIHFDVYVSRDVKKSELGVPDFRIITCRYADPPPSLLEMTRLSNESDGVSLKLAVVHHGSMSFYGLFEVDVSSNLNELG